MSFCRTIENVFYCYTRKKNNNCLVLGLSDVPILARQDRFLIKNLASRVRPPRGLLKFSQKLIIFLRFCVAD